MLKNHANEPDSVEILVRSILNEKTNNAFMEIELLGVERISEMREYHGIRVSLVGSIGNARTPFRVDFDVGDTIVPSAMTRTLPVLLNEFSKPTILTYSLESTISEKLDAIIRFMEATGRMKDFYDITIWLIRLNSKVENFKKPFMRLFQKEKHLMSQIQSK